jgi:hypothetical protein
MQVRKRDQAEGTAPAGLAGEAPRKRSGGGFRAVGQRVGWGLADQALSSATNFGVGILIARSVSQADYGSFSLAFATYLIALNVHRGLSTDPLNVRFSHTEPSAWRRATAAATGTALLVGLAFAVGCVIAGMLAEGPLRVSLLALGLCMPGLLLQDAWRLSFFTNGTGHNSFANDLLWAVLQISAFGVLILTGHDSIGAIVLAWGGAAGVAALFGIAQARFRPRPSQAPAWLKAQRDLAPQYLGANLTVAGFSAAGIYGLGLVAGLDAVGAVRVTEQLVLGPLNVAFQGVNLMAVPEAVRMLRRGIRQLLATALVAGVGLALMAVAIGVAILLMPDEWGRLLLKGAWEPARALVVPATITAAIVGLVSGAEIGLRALAQANRSLATRLTTSTLTLTGTVGGGAVNGAKGAMWGLAGAEVLAVTIWWWQLLRGVRSHVRNGGPPPPPDATAPPSPPAPAPPGIGPEWNPGITSPGMRLTIGDFVYHPPAAVDTKALPPDPSKPDGAR